MRYLVLIPILLGCVGTGSLSRPSSLEVKNVEIGSFRSRGIWHQTSGEPRPVVIMIPGSGPQGPEEIMPASMSSDGKEHAVFNSIAEPFVRANINVLQLGKPGVEYHDHPNGRFYDISLLENASWSDYLENARAAFRWVRQQKSVDTSRIYMLGHSQGTQVTSDIATELGLKGIILLGYSGESLEETVRWQIFERPIEHFIKTDVDKNQNGAISKAEGDEWPNEFQWNWSPTQSEVSIEEIRNYMRSDPSLKDAYQSIINHPFCNDGMCQREPLYDETARFSGDIYVFTGELDLQTPKEEALKLAEKCRALRKSNCFVKIVPGVQHSFNFPKGPRKHPLLDIAVAPVEGFFLDQLEKLAAKL